VSQSKAHPQIAPAHRNGAPVAFISLLRPSQWIKNAFVFAPAFFSGAFHQPSKILLAGVVFASFCCAASAAYILNDIFDRNRDAAHPSKRLRPISSGAVAVAHAAWLCAALVAGAIGLAALVSLPVLGWIGAYLFLNVAYSVRLKHIVIVDVFCIALGFVIRVAAGAAAVAVVPSAWIILATFLLALFLALAKRRQELALLAADNAKHRPVLESYSVQLADQLIAIVTPATALTYVLYTLDPTTIERFGAPSLYLTALPVIFGIFRYMYLVHQRSEGGAPAETLLRDRPLVIAIVVWIVSFAVLIYTDA
jgi:4-hydroxybenzoate polyprenyltransferase